MKALLGSQIRGKNCYNFTSFLVLSNGTNFQRNDLFVSNNATCLKYFHFQPIICGKYEFYGKEAGTGPSTKYHVYSDCGK